MQPHDTVSNNNINAESVNDWLMSNRDNCIRIVKNKCSDFTYEDCEEVFSDLMHKIRKNGAEKVLGQINEQSLFCHLNRQKEDYRRRKYAQRRGGKLEHLSLSVDEYSSGFAQSGSARRAIDAKKDLDVLFQKAGRDLEGDHLLLLGMIQKTKSMKPVEIYPHLTDTQRRRFLSEANRAKRINKKLRISILKNMAKRLAEIQSYFRGTGYLEGNL